MYYSRVGLCFLLTSNVINTVSDTSSVMVSTVALPTPAATSSVTTEAGEVNNRMFMSVH